MNKNKLRNRASAKLFKLADAVNIRNKASKKMFKKAKGLKKASKSHANQAKVLKRVINK